MQCSWMQSHLSLFLFSVETFQTQYSDMYEFSKDLFRVVHLKKNLTNRRVNQLMFVSAGVVSFIMLSGQDWWLRAGSNKPI
jgi:hypothetical protein